MIRCPECSKPIEADPATIRTLRCPHCGYTDRVNVEPTKGLHARHTAATVEQVVDDAQR